MGLNNDVLFDNILSFTVNESFTYCDPRARRQNPDIRETLKERNVAKV